MATTKPFAYNTGSTISNTQQLGSLAIATGGTIGGNVTWWMGPDEELGYVVTVPVSGNTQPTPVGVNASLGFFRSGVLSEASFISLARFLSNYTLDFNSGVSALSWLNSQGYWGSYPLGSPILIYSNNSASYMINSSLLSYSWGGSDFGVVGNNSQTESFSTPVRICGTNTFMSLSTRDTHVLGLTTNGIAYAWGSNTGGALGDDTTTSRLTPVAVCGGLTFSDISAGVSHALGLTTNGIAYCWGSNTSGQLGDSTIISKRTPVAVCGGYTFTSVAVGNLTSCGLTNTGQAYCWGNGTNGRLGDNSTTNKSTPVAVCGGL